MDQVEEIPRGIRNNNPGNLLAGSHWLGEIEPDGRYARFSDPVHGLRAMGKQLLAYQQKHGCRSIHDFISRWAPTNENDTEAYASDVASRMGISSSAFILLASDIRLLDLMKAIIHHEVGCQPYSDAEFEQALMMIRE